MQRWFIAAAALFTTACSVSRADYVVIRVYSKSPGIQMGNPGVPPMGGQPPVGVQPPMGGQPPRGSQPGFLGQRGVMGNEGQPPMGAGGPPPLGMNGMGMPGGVSQNITSNDFVTVVVEVKKSTMAPTGFRQVAVKPLTDKLYFMDSNFGTTSLYDENPNEIELQLIPSQQSKGMSGPSLKSPKEQYTERRTGLLKGKDRSPDRYLDEAIWCLRVGLPDRCIDYLTEIEKLLAQPTDKNPVSKRVTDVLANYRKIKPIIEDELVKKDKAANWKERLGYKNVAISKHYAIVHSSEDPKRDGVERRLEALENNFKTFYLLFAMKGKVLPAPTQKLVAILVADAQTFNRQREVFNVKDLVSDGFHARQENLAIFSPSRTDIASHNFNETMREVHRQYQLDLLSGQLPDLGPKDQAPRVAADARRAQTLALVERALAEESEIASATHEGSQQLVAETGLLPRNAPAPEWLRFGLASLFEMPKGPFAGRNQGIVRLAFWPGAGGPNWAWRLYFDEMQQEGLIPDQPLDLFYDALTDAWFERVRDLEHHKDTLEGFTEIKTAFLARARTLSWALTYYLFNHRFGEFDKFLAELSNLPRDTELDHYTLVTMFLRNFGYDAAGLTPANPKGKVDRYFGVSRAWVAAIRNDPATTVELKMVQPAATNPIGPIGPEGGPMEPGGVGSPIGPGGIGGPRGPGGVGGPGFPGGIGGPGFPGGPMGPGSRPMGPMGPGGAIGPGGMTTPGGRPMGGPGANGGRPGVGPGGPQPPGSR